MMLCLRTLALCNLQVENGVLLQRESSRSSLNLKKQKIKRWKCFAVSKTQKVYHHHHHNLLSVSLTFFSDLPLYDSPGKASFDEYLEDKPRLVKATFPGKIQQLNQEEWRIEMPKIELLFLKIWPTVDIKITCKTNGEAYPSDVPHYITKVLLLEMTNWEINGIHKDYRPSYANVCSRGAIYSEKIGTRSHLKFKLLINLSFLVPYVLNFVSNDVLQSIVKTALKAMIEDLKHKSIHKLVEDYNEFRKENKTNYIY
ncbi:uncharacterized protein LOC120080556 [Benincasa hispida]|uniref:uncharacterized protein LOC120080556 n=1 Tax=Benincasa hispida TaxID=102211 RepID=UPI001901DE58|nr:uncharacterized protein LOC120080556 [Benincasa hispida]